MKEQKKIFRTTKYYTWYVSNRGKIYRTSKTSGNMEEVQPKDLNGYKYMVFTNTDKKQELVGVHRIVAQAFCHVPAAYDIKDLQVDHINNNRIDNRASNLRWVTRKFNNSRLHARKARRLNAASESHAGMKLFFQFKDGTTKTYYTFKEAAYDIGCTTNYLYVVLKHKNGHVRKFDMKLVPMGEE